VVDKNGVLNPEGLRFDNEFIRHKLLDAIGDMYLAGYPILGAYHGTRPQPCLEQRPVAQIICNSNAYTLVTSTSP
jgi:UDP-3-O-[3-hydroxymyristoyl] N-acetylglucosamine deacetylase